jgi:hypothetical protein
MWFGIGLLDFFLAGLNIPFAIQGHPWNIAAFVFCFALGCLSFYMDWKENY